MERFYRTRLYQFLESVWIGWISVLFGIGAVFAALFFSVLIFGILYEVGWSVWQDDWSNWGRFASKKAEPAVVQQSYEGDSAELFSDVLAEVGRMREEIEGRISGEQPTVSDDKELLSRVTALEEMLKIKPEEVASIAVQSQRLVSLENHLSQTESRLQTQIANMYVLILGLFGTLVVTVLGAMIWSVLSGKRTQQ